MVASVAHAADCGPFRVGVKLYPGVYERVPGRSDYQGLDKDFFALLAERSGCRFDLVLESQPRIWAAIRSGRLDITSWVVPTPEREALVALIPLVSLRHLVLSWAAKEVRDETDFLARRELRAVAVRGASYGAAYDALLQQLRQQGRVSEVADVEVAIRVFFAKRVDLLIAYPFAVAAELRSETTPVRVDDWHPASRGVLSGLALSRRTVSPADQQRLLDALQGMQRDGSLLRLMRKHAPEQGVEPVSRLLLQ